jgi:murein DD-endopeptidase MepM/ murein hydrolase activator NlpD
MPARRVMGISLLLPGLLLAHPLVTHAETKPTKPPAKSAARARAAAPGGPCTHTVQRGESVARIAVRHGVNRQSLITANHLERPEALRPGQRLAIPDCVLSATVATGASAPAPLDGVLLARVGPRRVPTQLFLGVPDVNGRAIDFLWPVAGPVASHFGRRRSGWHAGIDIKADLGTPILAAAAGTVISSGWERSYGRVVRIQHPAGFITVYAHNLQNLVEIGDEVEAGSVIATVGRSGRSTAYHLHFEIRHGGMVYNPAHLLPDRDVMLARSDERPEPAAEEDDEDE